MDLPSERLPRTRGNPPSPSRLPRGVSARGRPGEGRVLPSLLRGILVAAAYSLCLITELCPFCLHSAFSNLSIFLVLTELSSPEPSALDLCCWGGSGVGPPSVSLISRFPCAPWLDPATPLPERACISCRRLAAPQPPPALCSILPNGQVAYFPPAQTLLWSPDFISKQMPHLLQFLSLLHQFKVHSSPKTCSDWKPRKPPWSLQPTLTTPVSPLLMHIRFRSAAVVFVPSYMQAPLGHLPCLTFSLPNPRLGSLRD